METNDKDSKKLTDSEELEKLQRIEDSMSEERRKLMQSYHKLPNEEIAKIAKNWTIQDWTDYRLCFGYYTMDEFLEKLMEMINSKNENSSKITIWKE